MHYVVHQIYPYHISHGATLDVDMIDNSNFDDGYFNMDLSLEIGVLGSWNWQLRSGVVLRM